MNKKSGENLQETPLRKVFTFSAFTAVTIEVKALAIRMFCSDSKVTAVTAAM